MKRLAAKFRRSNAPKRELWTPAGSEDNLGLMHGDMELDATDPDRSQAGTAPASSYLITEPTGLSRYQLWLDIFLRSIRDWIIQQLHQERAQRGGFLWIPVLLGIGCAAYFNLPREPWTFAFPLLTLLLSILAGAMKRSNWLPVCLAMLLIAAGVSLAQIRTQMLSTIMLERSVIASITGRVERTEPRPQGRVRYTLSVLRLDGVKQVPERVRLTARQKDNLFEFGDVISGRARLAPPPGLALPGGYDFRFFSWYAGIGGSGFFLGAPHLIEPKTANNWSIRTWAAVTREHIANLLRQALPPQSSALATALIVGERSQIDEPINEALRRSGLAHILAISGLHMALVTLTVIGTVRLILASVPTLALKYPVKKIAGCFGLVSATFYLLLSGANLSTQRAYIMVVVLLLATLMDRRALTMRNVALAALVVLILAPEAVLQPGFQMSFAAAAALIATYEWSAQRRWRRSQPRPMPHSRLSDFKRQASRYISGLILVPLIAGMATGLYAGFPLLSNCTIGSAGQCTGHARCITGCHAIGADQRGSHVIWVGATHLNPAGRRFGTGCQYCAMGNRPEQVAALGIHRVHWPIGSVYIDFGNSWSVDRYACAIPIEAIVDTLFRADDWTCHISPDTGFHYCRKRPSSRSPGIGWSARPVATTL